MEKQSRNYEKYLNSLALRGLWNLIQINPGLNGSEIADKLEVTQATISEQLKILKNANLVKIKLREEKRGVSKLHYPTWKGHFEYMAKSMGKGDRLTEKDYDKIDNFFLSEEMLGIFRSVGNKAKKLAKTTDPKMVQTLLTVGVTGNLDVISKNPELKKKWEEYREVNDKLFKEDIMKLIKEK